MPSEKIRNLLQSFFTKISSKSINNQCTTLNVNFRDRIQSEISFLIATTSNTTHLDAI